MDPTRQQLEALQDIFSTLQTALKNVARYVRYTDQSICQAEALWMAQVDAHAYIQNAIEGVEGAIMELRSAISDTEQVYQSRANFPDEYEYDNTAVQVQQQQ